LKSRYDELSRLIEINKTYLININQQLLKPPYQNDNMIKLKVETNDYIKYLESVLSTHLIDCLFYMLYDLELTEGRFL
jgi:hypothetical protein